MIVADGALLVGPRQWLPHLRPVIRIAGDGKLKTRRHDAHHRKGPPIKFDVFADDFRIAAKTAAPQSVAQDDFVVVAGLVFGVQEITAEQRLRVQNGKQSPRRCKRTNCLRMACTSEGVAAESISRHAFKGAALIAPVNKICRRYRELMRARK